MSLVDRLQAISEDDLAEELSGQYQGDILMTDEQMELYRSKKIATRNGLVQKRYRWDGARVPFTIVKHYYGKVVVMHNQLLNGTIEINFGTFF